ncbi:MAG: DNA mismatch repair endonuclease MutL [Clostridia bacterium]|nr:DNA mismatch repair endonuclease MutL [Clostridia bacterium]
MAINVLPSKIFNRIAAGEVVEKPASVVKELVENSIDAGATKIKVEIVEGGIKKISVSDNGCGLEKEDLPLAFLPHATSKISEIDDLDGIATLGFRGEALASIASVSMVTLSTKTKESESGYMIEANGGDISKISEVSRLNGTTLTVQNLFYNTPVRAKFLKKPKSEESEVTHLVEKFMLSHPEIDFVYVVDGKELYNHASGQLDEVIYLLYGKDVYDNLLKLDYEEDEIRVEGFIVSPKLSRPNRTYQTLFVNDRYVENYMVSACVQGAYEPVLMKGRYPIYVIKLKVPFTRVDVNVHPNKKEVKFDNSSRIFGIIRRAVEKALMATNLIADFEFTAQEEKEWSKFDIKNEQNPAQTGFDSYQKSTVDKMSPLEGASFNVSVDSKEAEKKLVSPLEYNKNGIEFINMPNFASVKGDQIKRKNKPGGNIFFDQAGDSFLYEAQLSVRKEMEAEKAQVEKKSAEENAAMNESQLESQKQQTLQEEKFLKVDAEEIKIVGVVFKTYIITEFGDSIYVVDQHAMHERQLYDKFKAEVDGNNVSKQGMLVPYTFKLTSKDREIFDERIDNLRAIGFDILCKDGEYSIKSVPFVIAGINLSKFVEEILADEGTGDKTASALINEKLCQTACKHAIRAGDSVSKEQIMYLIDKMKEGVALCPHGRPIIVKITRKELEKMFKRVL